MGVDGASLASELRERYGTGLRAVATYDAADYELHHADDRVRERYDADDLAAIHEDILLDGLTLPRQEELFADMGDVSATVRLFEHGWVVHYHRTGERSGLLVVFTDEAAPTVPELRELGARFEA